MSRPAALVVAGPGTNRDTRRRRSPSTSPAPSRRSCWPASSPPTRRCSTTARIVVVAGGFSYGDALGAGRMLALDLTVGDGGRLGERLRAFVASGRPVIGICNGFQVLTRTGLLPGALGHNAARPLRLPLGRARRRAGQPRASGPPASTTTSTARSPTARAATSTPTRRRSPPPARSRCATSAATPTARSPTSPASATRPASCSA